MEKSNFKVVLTFLSIGLLAIIVFGLIWFFFLGPETPVGLGWYLFSFAAGLTMIVLPCTLPLAFVIVPLSLGKGAIKGLSIAIFFGLGVAITLSMYGVIAALVGQVAIGAIGAPLETVKNWLYFFAGLFAFLFALGEIGLLKFRMPTYTGSVPAFIQKKGDYLKALSLGLFLGNIGVGCPHPATPVILTRIAASGDVFYGWMLFFVHAAGRVLPLILLALLAILGINALKWLIARKDKIERATGWGMVYVAGFILVLGLFTHDWWVYSGQHTLFESITQEERFIGIISQKIGVDPPHVHGIPTGTGLFGLPLWLGNWVLVFLWILPMWWYYHKRKMQNVKRKVETPNDEEVKRETSVMPYRFWLFISLTLLLALTFIWVLPDRFLNHTLPQKERMMENMPMMGGEALSPHKAPADANALAGKPEGVAHGGEVHEALYHEESEVKSGLGVNFNILPVPIILGNLARLDFFVNEKPGDIPVNADFLEIDHEKPMHVIGVRDDLAEFFHKHPMPTLSPGILSFDYIFQKPGNYKVWSQVQKNGLTHLFGHPIFSVNGEGEKSKRELFFGRNRIVGNYQVSLKNEKFFQGREEDLELGIHDVFGNEVELDDYLGAKMHVVIIKEDLSRFIHTHPEEDNHMSNLDYLVFNKALAHGGVDDESVALDHKDTFNFHATFNEIGNYKIFAQFRPKDANLLPDEALLASFWVKVEEKAPFFISEWWLYLLVSLVLIVFLSFGVNKYLSVKSQ